LYGPVDKFTKDFASATYFGRVEYFGAFSPRNRERSVDAFVLHGIVKTTAAGGHDAS
jgi:hypothetical protein